MISVAPHCAEIENRPELWLLHFFFFCCFFLMHDCEFILLTCANVTASWIILLFLLYTE